MEWAGWTDAEERIGWAIMEGLHSQVPEDKRPIGWTALNSEQLPRILAAARGVLALDLDGKRWRALMSSQRMHFMGSAGFDHSGPEPMPRSGAPLHFGMEFWDVHEAHDDPRYPDARERALMVNYADEIIRRGEST